MLLLLLLTVQFQYVLSSTINNTVVCIADEEVIDTLWYCDYNYSNFSYALETHYENNYTTYVLQCGNHTLSTNIDIVFKDLVSINFKSMNESENAVIECESQEGLFFNNSHNITIQSLTFIGCGMLNNFSESSERHFTINISLHFFQCSNITLDSVIMISSTGSAVYMVPKPALHGQVDTEIRNSKFLYSGTLNKLGGGVVINFSKCHPDSTNCNLCANKSGEVQRSRFRISNCTFKGNKADINQSDVQEMNSPNDLHHGQGGGLFISLGVSCNISVLIKSCSFEENKALYGAGVYIKMEDYSANNTIIIKNTTFKSNNARQGGGGVRIEFLNYKKFVENQIHFEQCNFTSNHASTGGGVSFISANNISNPINFTFRNCIWTFNSADTGSSVDMTAWLKSPSGLLPQPSFNDCTFSNNSMQKSCKKTCKVAIGTVYLNSIPVIFNNVNFTENQATAIYAINSHIKFSKESYGVFCNNSGMNGGAIALIGHSTIVVGNQTVLDFTDNKATDHGGAIYAFVISQQRDMISIDNCFVRPEHTVRNFKTNWGSTQFNFKGNQAHQNGETIFATTLQYCGWEKSNGLREKKGIFCLQNWNFEEGNCTTEIKTLPAHIKYKDDSLSIIPGKPTNMSLIVTDELNNILEKYILTANDSTNIDVDNDYRYISDGMLKVSLTHNKSYTGTENVTLYSMFPKVLEVLLPVNIDSINENCPPGYFISNTSENCECNEKSFNHFEGVLRCDSNFTALLRKGYWMGEYKGQIVVGKCKFCQAKNNIKGEFITLPQKFDEIDDIICKDNNSGVLCTNCSFSYAYSITGYECVDWNDCKSYTPIYTIAELLPFVILFFCLLFTNFPLASGYLNGAIFFAQTISTSLDISGNGEVPLQNITGSQTLITVNQVLYSIWNINFIFPVKYCNLHLPILFTMTYVVALFPLMFVLALYIYYRLDERTTIIYKCWQCIFSIYICYRIKNWWNTKVKKFIKLKTGESLRNILASCILLAYTRCVLNSCNILNPIFLYNGTNDLIAIVQYFDGSTEYGIGDHKISMAFAVAIATFFLVPLPVVLLFGRYDLERAKNNYNQKNFFYILMESFQRDFKNGRNDDEQEAFITSTSSYEHWSKRCLSKLYFTVFMDLRWVSSVYFILRLGMPLTLIIPDRFITTVLIQQVLACMMVGLFLILQPYKKSIHNKIDGGIFLLIIVINSIKLHQFSLANSMVSLSLGTFIVQYILMYIPMIWIAYYIVRRAILQITVIMKEQNKRRNERLYQVPSPSYGTMNN